MREPAYPLRRFSTCLLLHVAQRLDRHIEQIATPSRSWICARSAVRRSKSGASRIALIAARSKPRVRSVTICVSRANSDSPYSRYPLSTRSPLATRRGTQTQWLISILSNFQRVGGCQTRRCTITKPISLFREAGVFTSVTQVGTSWRPGKWADAEATGTRTVSQGSWRKSRRLNDGSYHA